MSWLGQTFTLVTTLISSLPLLRRLVGRRSGYFRCFRVFWVGTSICSSVSVVSEAVIGKNLFLLIWRSTQRIWAGRAWGDSGNKIEIVAWTVDSRENGGLTIIYISIVMLSLQDRIEIENNFWHWLWIEISTELDEVGERFLAERGRFLEGTGCLDWL